MKDLQAPSQKDSNREPRDRLSRGAEGLHDDMMFLRKDGAAKMVPQPPARILRSMKPMDSPEVLVILNPVSSHNQNGEVREALERGLREQGRSARVVETSPGDDARDEVQRRLDESLDRGCDRVIVAGGDGTLSLVATCLLARPRSHPVALGIVPAGTANVLARELGIPGGIDEALSLALEGTETIDLDAMMAADRAILTQLGAGPDAEMIRDTSREKQVKLGRLAYLLTLLRRARRQPAHAFDIEVDHRRHRLRAWQVVVANVGAVGSPPLTWGPGIDPTDGAVDVAAFDVHGVADYW